LKPNYSNNSIKNDPIIIKSESKQSLSNKKLEPLNLQNSKQSNKSLKTIGSLNLNLNEIHINNDINGERLKTAEDILNTHKSQRSLNGNSLSKQLSLKSIGVNKSVESFKTSDFEKKSNIIDIDKEIKAMFKNKNLSEFDLYEDTKTPQEWLDECKKSDSEIHGYTIIYINNKYEWNPCSIITYIEETKRYRVKVLSNGFIKDVTRLSLRFASENKQQFDKRVKLTKQLREEYESNYKLSLLISRVTNDAYYTISKELKTKIFNHLLESLPKKVDVNNEVDMIVNLKQDLEK